MSDTLILTGETTAERPAPADDLLSIYGRIFDAGLSAGRENAGREDIFEQVALSALDGLLDEGAPEHVREKVFANVIGFTEGWREVMTVTPLQFLTRYQSWKVSRMPRALRQAWTAEYRKGIKRWRAKGGSLGGARPVLPALPDEAPTPPEQRSRIIVP